MGISGKILNLILKKWFGQEHKCKMPILHKRPCLFYAHAHAGYLILILSSQRGLLGVQALKTQPKSFFYYTDYH